MRPNSATWSALGTTASIVVTDPCALSSAREVVEHEIAAIDLACSRFRPDSELELVHAAAGDLVEISALLTEAVAVALDAAIQTRGLVNPTVGAAVISAGYDQDFAEITDDRKLPVASPSPGPGAISLDRTRGTLRVAQGVRLDLGATAKALAADRAAAGAAAAIAPEGVLVSLGGDIAVAGGVPPGGWPIGLADGHDQRATATVAIESGGLATSSTTQRRWRRAGREFHHIIDPRTGEPATIVWRTVSVAARSCVEANTASTAAIILGKSAPAWLTARALPSRLVAADGTVVTTCGWSRQAAAA